MLNRTYANNQLISHTAKKRIIDALQNAGEFGLADWFASDRKKLLFGQGSQAFICYDLAKRLGIPIAATINTDVVGDRFESIPKELPSYSISNFPFEKSGYDILLSVNKKHYDSIIPSLQGIGFININAVQSWITANDIMRTEFYLEYLESYGKKVSSNLLEYGNFKITDGTSFGPESVYKSMYLSEFFDIVAPSIYDDTRYCKEEPYEIENVRVDPGDIVFDLGANIGMFSCVAASKLSGGDVYAFEPTPSTIEMLKLNTKLYNNIHLIPLAVSDHDGVCTFYENNLLGDYATATENTMVAERLRGAMGEMKEIEVATTSIDSYVQKNKLKHVDFIKANIEGAERAMLKGATKTLKKFAPKLSLCMYHCQDDHEVITQIILDANPNYIIKHGTFKLYAHVPK